MNESKNSISNDAKNQSIELANAIEVLSKYLNALSSNDTNIIMTLKDKNGVEQKMNLPSLFTMQSDIERLDKNQQAFSGNGSTSYIQNADGSYNKIITSKRNQTPNPISNLKVPLEFDRKNNWFFENFLSPLLYVKFDLTDSIDETIRRVSVKRIILNLANSSQLSIFNNSLSGRNDLKYEDVLTFLNANNISYFIDDDTYEIPPAILRYEGTFGIVSTFDSIDEATGKPLRYYKFSNINYTDNIAQFKGTEILKSGNILSLTDSTKFEVLTVDTSTRNVTLKRIEGKDAIRLGDNVLKIESKKISSKEIHVNVGFNEKQIIFVNPINTDANVASTQFSNGVCFDSNTLSLVDGNGKTILLEEYYQKEVSDFGIHLMNLAKDKNIPTLFGLTPSAPVIEESNFKVVQINNHLNQNNLTKNIKNKVADKTRLRNELENLDIEIRNLSSKLKTISSTSNEFSQISNQIDKIVNTRKNKTSEYNAVLSSLNLIYKENPADRIRPKYKIRGFWEIPSPKFDARTGKQEVVQFNIQYRYLSRTGTPAETQQLNFNKQNETTFGTFSNWNTMKSEPRKRFYNLTNDAFSWDEENNKDAEAINSNQLDIPITPGESVEIRIQSISEAGYPNNPLVSNFSSTVKIDFPDELNSEIDLYSVLEESAREEERSLIYKEIQDYGIEKHTRDSETINNRYFAHKGDQLNSGITDSRGNFLSVTEAFNLLKDSIASLKGDIAVSTPIEIKNGKLKVYIEGKGRNGSTVVYPVKNNSTVEIQPPSYYSIISKLPQSERRGAIIKETYNLVIENSGDGVLHLNSKYPGATYEGLPTLQGSNLVWRNSSFNDNEYLNFRKYDKVPVKYSNFQTYADISGNETMFGYGLQQNSQVAGQFIYCRYKDINGTKSLYGTGSVLQPLSLPSPSNSTGNKKTFIWDGGWFNPLNVSLTALNPYEMAPTGNGNLNEFAVHIEHTDLKLNRKELYELLADGVLTRQNYLEHSKYFNIEKGSSDFLLQSELTKNSYGKFQKFGFYENDRFLIGKNTTGMYFYMNPKDPASVRVNGNDSSSVNALQPGEKINIPLTIEFRFTDFYDESDTYIYNKKITSNNLTVASISPSLKINTQSVPSVHLNSSQLTTAKQYLGVVGGYSTDYLKRNNLDISYEKVLGFDITSRNNEMFSFDVRANVIYGSTNNYININEEAVNVNDTKRIKISADSSISIDSSLFGKTDNLI